MCALAMAIGCGGGGSKADAPKGGNQNGADGGGGPSNSDGSATSGDGSMMSNVGNSQDNAFLSIVDALCKRGDECAKELNVAAVLQDQEWCRWATILGDAGDAFADGEGFWGPLAKGGVCAREFPTSVADPAAVKACVEGIAATDCSTGIGPGENGIKDLEGPCLAAFASMTDFWPKALKVGAPCDGDLECGLNEFCDIPRNSDGAGKCAAYTQTAGMPCVTEGGSGDGLKLCIAPLVCAGGARYCQELSGGCTCEDAISQPVLRMDAGATGRAGDDCSDIGCAPGFVCDADTNRCTSAALGEPCTESHHLSFCRGGKFVQPKVGDACKDNNDCADPTVCFAGKCTEADLCAKEGEPCYFICAEGLSCTRDTNTCVPAGKLSDPCNVPDHGGCGPDLACSDDHTCVSRAGLGDVCNSDNAPDCASGLHCDSSRRPMTCIVDPRAP